MQGDEKGMLTLGANVHAYVMGELVSGALVLTPEARQVRYNPYETKYFVFTETGEEARGLYRTVLLSPEGKVFVFTSPVAREVRA